eukprot:TRINITY_DN47286_c0_g1_i1.p1 TRINITY_DN47286_c0_g1~~TRINITY_DN47286_c0_g1_i1.p1  ORF type:complete len:761 (+),score=148.35 TRINITY_DN47286_c0_g1_i1:117-2399(+)
MLPCTPPADLSIVHVGLLQGGAPDLPGFLGAHPQIVLRRWRGQEDQSLTGDWGLREGQLPAVATDAWSSEELRCLLSASPRARVVLSVRHPIPWLETKLYEEQAGAAAASSTSSSSSSYWWRSGRNLTSGRFGSMAERLLRTLPPARMQPPRLLIVDVDHFVVEPRAGTRMLQKFLQLSEPFPLIAATPALWSAPSLQEQAPNREALDLCNNEHAGLALLADEPRKLRFLIKRGDATTPGFLEAQYNYCRHAEYKQVVSQHTSIALACQFYEGGINWEIIRQMFDDLLAADWSDLRSVSHAGWLLEARFMLQSFSDVESVKAPRTPPLMPIHIACPLGAWAQRILLMLRLVHEFRSTGLVQFDSKWNLDVRRHVNELGLWTQKVISEVSLEQVAAAGWAGTVAGLAKLKVEIRQAGLCKKAPMFCCHGEAELREPLVGPASYWVAVADGDPSKLWKLIGGYPSRFPGDGAGCTALTSAWEALHDAWKPAPVQTPNIQPTEAWRVRKIAYEQPSAPCDKAILLGGVDRAGMRQMGAYYVCAEKADGAGSWWERGNCRLFSVGIGPEDARFEEQTAELLGCEVYAIDVVPTNSKLFKGKDNGHRFQQFFFGVEDDDSTTPPTRSMKSLLTKSFGANKRFDGIKLSLGEVEDVSALTHAALVHVPLAEELGLHHFIIDFVLYAEVGPHMILLLGLLKELEDRGWKLLGRAVNPQWCVGHHLLDVALNRVPIPGHSMHFPAPYDYNVHGITQLCAINLTFLKVG